MSDLSLVAAMAAITYASRAVFLVRPREMPGGFVGRFLDTFPLALFVALATIGFAAPEGELEGTFALWGAAGGLLGAFVTRRSLIGILAFGGAAWWATKLFG